MIKNPDGILKPDTRMLEEGLKAYADLKDRVGEAKAKKVFAGMANKAAKYWDDQIIKELQDADSSTEEA